MRRLPLVLLHGFTGGPGSYSRVLAELRTYTDVPVIAPYLCGHGPHWLSPESPVSDGGIADGALARGATVDGTITRWSASGSFGAEIGALATTLAAAGVSANTPATLVGYSLGARLALGLLLAKPTWFRRCILIGVNPGLPDSAERASRLAEDQARARQLLTHGLEPFLQDWERLPLFASQTQVPASALSDQALQRREHHATGLAYSLVRTGLGRMPDYWPGLGQIHVPVGLVVGALDGKFRAVAQQMQRAMPSSELTVVTNVGHNVPLEAPQELAALLDLLPVES